VIGACYDGPFGIDLCKDGPHAMIASTTGIITEESTSATPVRVINA